MATAEVQRLLVTIGLKDGLSGPIGKINRSLTGFDKGIGKIKAGLGQMGAAALRVGAIAGAAGLALLVTQVKAGLDSLSQLENAQAQTQAVLESTGGVAGVTAVQIRKLSESLEDLAPQFDDKAIQGAQNLLLTFTKIGKDIFPETTLAVLNMSQALGQDLKSSVIQIGKALNDPVRGITALRRVGVAFTKEQEDQIKVLVKSGRTLDAQRLILKELATEFGGSAEKGLGKFAKVQARVKDAVEDLQMALASGLLPVIERLAPKLNAFLRDPKTVANIERLGQQIADLFSEKNIASAAQLFREVQQGAQIAFAVAKSAVDLFKSLPPELQKAAIAALVVSRVPGAGLVASGIGSIVGVLLRNLTTITAANVTVIGGNVTGGGLPGGVGGFAFGPAVIAAAVGGGAFLLFKDWVDKQPKWWGSGPPPSATGTAPPSMGGRSGGYGRNLIDVSGKLRGAIEKNTAALKTGTEKRDSVLDKLLNPILDWQKTRMLGGLKGPAEGGNVARGFLGRLDKLTVTDPEAASIAATIANHLIRVSDNVKTLEGTETRLSELQKAAMAAGNTALANRLGTEIALVKQAIANLPAPVVNVTVPVNVSVRQLATSLDFAKTYHMAGTY